MSQRQRPISIAMLALGGQGGGVLTRWLVDTAEANGYLAQSTYIAGVAQRTGATVYCVEMFPEGHAEDQGREPVFTPYPIPGDVDLVIAGEMAETGRAIQKGFVTPNITTLIASSHRVYSVAEKSAMDNGIMDQSKVAEIAAKVSKRFVCFDMQSVADETGSVISAVLLGAIAGSGTLPFDRDAFETTIRKTGRSVDANLEGFSAGFAAVTEGATPVFDDVGGAVDMPPAEPAGPNGRALAERIDAELPPAVRNVALHGALRSLEYQDVEYASAYLDRVRDVCAIDTANGGDERDFALTAEVARQLALQMCYEDTIRVAELKTRPERFSRIRAQVAASGDQPVRVVEYFHPRIEEFCDTLPAALGSFILRSPATRKLLAPLFRKGRTINTTGVSGFLLLSLLARFKRFRRSTYRFRGQQAFIDDWLGRIEVAVPDDYGLALSVARCIEIVKGYGDTYERGLTRYRATIESIDKVSAGDRAQVVQQLHSAALADENGQAFDYTLARLEAAG